VRARRLEIFVRALSRFAESFETAPVYIEGASRLLQRRQGLRRSDQATPGPSVSVRVPASSRPAPCEPKRPEPAFIVEREPPERTCEGTVRYHWRRRALTRLYFARGWFSSGEGERVGIVLWPPNYFDGPHDFTGNTVSYATAVRSIPRMSVQDFADDDLGPGGAYVTRCGGDPIRKDAFPQDAVFLPPSAFNDGPVAHRSRCWVTPHDPRVVGRVAMPVPNQGAEQTAEATNGSDATTGALDVSLLTYEPCFDLDREEWYVDVDLQTDRPSEPIVRFGLVRYQENALPGLEVSRPVTVLAPVLPARDVDITMDEAARTLSIVVYGRGSTGIRDLQPEKSLLDLVDSRLAAERARDFDTIKQPLLRIALFHETIDYNNQPTHREPIPLDLCAAADGMLEVKPLPIDQRSGNNEERSREILEWRCEIELPPDLDGFGPGQLVAHIEEVDRRMPATYREEPVQVSDIFDKETFLDSGPRFIARVPFLTIGSPKTPKPSCVQAITD
jgi:hypothetical protein